MNGVQWLGLTLLTFAVLFTVADLADSIWFDLTRRFRRA